MFSGSIVLPDSKQTELGSSNQEASSLASKNTRYVLVSCCTWKCFPTAIPGGMNISEVSGRHLFRQMSSQWGSQKLLQLLVSQESQPTFLILNSMKWPYYQKDINQVNLNPTTPWNLALRILELVIWILLDVNLSLNQILLTFLHYVRQTWTTKSTVAISLWEFIFL